MIRRHCQEILEETMRLYRDIEHTSIYLPGYAATGCCISERLNDLQALHGFDDCFYLYILQPSSPRVIMQRVSRGVCPHNDDRLTHAL